MVPKIITIAKVVHVHHLEDFWSYHDFSRFISDFGTKASLTLHIVGANIYEVMGIIKWEYLAHRLPTLKNLTMAFVGPDLDPGDDGSESVGQCEVWR